MTRFRLIFGFCKDFRQPETGKLVSGCFFCGAKIKKDLIKEFKRPKINKSTTT